MRVSYENEREVQRRNKGDEQFGGSRVTAAR
jgi:hypothetical protein